jgi:hypothetical protein
MPQGSNRRCLLPNQLKHRSFRKLLRTNRFGQLSSEEDHTRSGGPDDKPIRTTNLHHRRHCPEVSTGACGNAASGKLANVSLTVIAAIDETHGQAGAYCTQGTRSAGHQKRLLERAALVLGHFDEAAIRVQGQAFDAILNRSWNEEPVTRIVERIVEVPQKGIIGRLFGK